jgi:retron-type reverse transcriptase
MTILLEEIWKPIFKQCNTGFRPGLNQHTALKQISTWNNITWVIKGDIKSYVIDHSILANILSERIKDKRFIDLYWKLVKAGYVELSTNTTPLKEECNTTLLEIPQKPENIISPVLLNIYLHALDEFITTSLITKYSSKSVCELKNNKKTSQIRFDYKIHYVRYAKDWIIGLAGPKNVAKAIRSDI